MDYSGRDGSEFLPEDLDINEKRIFMPKSKNGYTLKGAVKLARDYAEIVDGLRYYQTRNDAGITDEEDTKDLDRILRKVDAFKRQYGEAFFNKHFRRTLDTKFFLSTLEGND